MIFLYCFDNIEFEALLKFHFIFFFHKAPMCLTDHLCRSVMIIAIGNTDSKEVAS